MQQLLNLVKENDEDYEWYPSTAKMMKVIADDIRSRCPTYSGTTHKILDVGCGDGNALELIEKQIGNGVDEHGQNNRNNIYFRKFGIEKSQTLINNMKDDVFVIGSDFSENNLIDKPMDIIFSNPPYSEYSEWVCRIIEEGCCEWIYLIIPQRWKENESVLKSLKRRCGYDPEQTEYSKFDSNPVEVLDSSDFLDSEYRKARAKVDIVRVQILKKESPFDIWFDLHFSINADKEKSYTGVYETQSKRSEAIKAELVQGQNLIERLVELYEQDLNKLLSVYKQLESIDYSLLKELGVNVADVKSGLQEKIGGLKNLYWKELFENLDKISDRLTSKFRKRLLDTLFSHTTIDITIDNMYNIVLWVIRNANKYQDEQLVDMYREMTEQKNIRLYKSNKHFVSDSWRYNYKNQASHYKLDYRLVFPNKAHYYNSWDAKNGLSKSAFNFISDIFTIAKTLGFDLHYSGLVNKQWEFGRQERFYDMEDEVFAEIRPYKNGNLHCKFNQKFIMKLNIEVGKLTGWIKDPVHCAEEMDIPVADVMEFYDSHIKLEVDSKLMIGASK